MKTTKTASNLSDRLLGTLRVGVFVSQLLSIPHAKGNHLPTEWNVFDATDEVVSSSSQYKVIYGEDDRAEVANYPDATFRHKAKSVAGMVANRKLVQDFFEPDLYSFFKQSAERRFNLCEGEKYADQIVLPICSGFLVDEEHIVTAAHCFQSTNDCENFSWVFDYTEGTEKIHKDQIYGCQEIVARELKNTRFSLKDYMVIKLDRPVTDREPLAVRKEGRPNYGEELVIIGHPLGLPQKIADGAEVKLGNPRESLFPPRNLFKKRDFFMANLDAFVGNSGSPVFNERTGLVEGILIEGSEDFEEDLDNLCDRVVSKKDSTLVTEEKVFRINRIPFLSSSHSTGSK